jgi:hypothetical protein
MIRLAPMIFSLATVAILLTSRLLPDNEKIPTSILFGCFLIAMAVLTLHGKEDK